MTEAHPTSTLDWAHEVKGIPESGLVREKAASAEERRQIAQALDILDVADLKANYRIARLAGGGYHLTGSITADVAQSCVVTLEPVSEKLDEDFDVEFWQGGVGEESGQDASVLEGRDVEPLERGEIPVGRIVFETLSAGLDPYPRKDGAAFDWRDEKAAAAEAKSNPFAALAKLKDKR